MLLGLLRHSANMWGVLSGLEKAGPRTELPLVIDHPTSHNAALIVADPPSRF